MGNRERLKNSRRWVIKIGSALLTDEGKGLDRSLMQKWVAQIISLRERGIKVTLVSSGAVAEGMQRLGWESRPTAIHELQAAAAVGQMGLIQAYESNFMQYGVKTAQILLTHEDLISRTRYLNARSTLLTLIDLGIVPIVNENDTVVTDEIRFGDNDNLAALVANLIEAEILVILTDQKGLFDADPRNNPDAKLLSTVNAGDPELEVMSASGKGELGCGGMLTKVKAAERAARSGAATLIAHGRADNVLQRLADGEVLGTLFEPSKEAFTARKLWIANQLKPKGTLEIDDGAVAVLTRQGKSLLPIGVVAVAGNFQRGEVVVCVDANGHEIARGLVNYSATDAKKIIRKSSDQIEAALGYQIEPEIIHRSNMVLMVNTRS